MSVVLRLAMRWRHWAGWLALVWIVTGCQTPPGVERTRRGDEIMVCGRWFRVGTPVVLWTDPGGYDAYRVERRFSAWTNASWEDHRRGDQGFGYPEPIRDPKRPHFRS
jgi:hypothetical protein